MRSLAVALFVLFLLSQLCCSFLNCASLGHMFFSRAPPASRYVLLLPFRFFPKSRCIQCSQLRRLCNCSLSAIAFCVPLSFASSNYRCCYQTSSGHLH